MSHRFFCTERIPYSERNRCTVTLAGDEAHHATRVMRLTEGDRLCLFDGSGWEYDAEVLTVSRGEVRLAVRSGSEADREPAAEVTIGVAAPKGDRQKVLVEKLTELGVARLTPIVTERGVAQPKPTGIEKLRRAVIEASKQCGRNRLMRVDEPMALADFLQSVEADSRLIAHPTGPAPAAHSEASSVAIAIGPEGGFTDDEVAIAVESGWRATSFGKSILRIETAAIAAAALFTIR